MRGVKDAGLLWDFVRTHSASSWYQNHDDLENEDEKKTKKRVIINSVRHKCFRWKWPLKSYIFEGISTYIYHHIDDSSHL